MNQKTLNEKVAHSIKKMRELKDLKQEYVAGKLGIGKTTYVDIENGKREITLHKLEQIAAIFKTDVQHILDFDATNFYDVHHNHNGIVNHHHSNEEYELLKENIKLLKEEIMLVKKENRNLRKK